MRSSSEHANSRVSPLAVTTTRCVLERVVGSDAKVTCFEANFTRRKTPTAGSHFESVVVAAQCEKMRRSAVELGAIDGNAGNDGARRSGCVEVDGVNRHMAREG